MNKILIITLFLVLSISSVSAQVSIEPEEWEEDLKTGDSFEKQIEVIWFGENKTDLEIFTEIEANETNSEGISIDHDPKVFTLEPGESQDITLEVSASRRLVPDTFTFTSEIGVLESDEESEQEEQNKDGSGGQSGGQPPPNQEESSEDESEDGENIGNQEDGESEGNESQESGPEESESLVDEIEETYEEEKSESRDFVPVNIAVSFSLGVLVLLLSFL